MILYLVGSSLVLRNETDFFECWSCMLQFCWIHLLVLGVLCRFVDIFYVDYQSYANKDSQFLSSLYALSFFPFIGVGRTSSGAPQMA